MRIVVASRTDPGRRRARNEDAILVRPSPNGTEPRMLVAIADGMGGAAAGDLASQEAIRALDTTIVHGGSNPGDALVTAFRCANSAVRARAASSAELTGAGTTLVAAIIDGRSAWVANVGDSRGYRFGRTSSEQVTRDHTLVEDERRAGTLTQHEAATSRYRNVLTRNLGGSQDIAVDLFGPIALAPDDALVLSSDGLHDHVAADEIEQVVRSLPVDDACEQLVALANARGGPDNISVIIARLVDDERPEA